MLMKYRILLMGNTVEMAGGVTYITQNFLVLIKWKQIFAANFLSQSKRNETLRKKINYPQPEFEPLELKANLQWMSYTESFWNIKNIVLVNPKWDKNTNISENLNTQKTLLANYPFAIRLLLLFRAKKFSWKYGMIGKLIARKWDSFKTKRLDSFSTTSNIVSLKHDRYLDHFFGYEVQLSKFLITVAIRRTTFCQQKSGFLQRI